MDIILCNKIQMIQSFWISLKQTTPVVKIIPMNLLWLWFFSLTKTQGKRFEQIQSLIAAQNQGCI